MKFESFRIFEIVDHSGLKIIGISVVPDNISLLKYISFEIGINCFIRVPDVGMNYLDIISVDLIHDTWEYYFKLKNLVGCDIAI